MSANPDVLAFYKELPFNYAGAAEIQADAIRAHDQLDAYPVLKPLLRRGVEVLDAGCGAGWLVNTLSYHFGAKVTGIDFNPIALAQGRAVAQLLNVASRFEEADLFAYRRERPFDLVISIGVLCVTNNCLEGIRHLCRLLLEPGGHLFIGLYHRYGRQPILDHFARLRDRGADEDALFTEFRRLHANILDETHLRSWFRDQILHPHETLHTMREMMPVLDDEGMSLIATSVNGFQPLPPLDRLYAMERTLGFTTVENLRNGVFTPGFFVFLARKQDQSKV